VVLVEEGRSAHYHLCEGKDMTADIKRGRVVAKRGQVELPPNEAAEYAAHVRQAEADITSRQPADEIQVNFKWTRAQLAVVQRAAGLSGISYQNFIKKALMDYSVAEIQKLEGHVHI
jgi:predicted DNA binding CopG/RHH family protein